MDTFAASSTRRCKNLASSGDKVRALQEVMREVRSTAGFEHPRYWAPFVLIGSER